MKLDKDKLTSLFESWIPPFIQVATKGYMSSKGSRWFGHNGLGVGELMWLVKTIAPALTLLVCFLLLIHILSLNRKPNLKLTLRKDKIPISEKPTASVFMH